VPLSAYQVWKFLWESQSHFRGTLGLRRFDAQRKISPMTKTLRVAALTVVFALFAAPVFAGPGGTDPPPPPPSGSGNLAASVATSAILSAFGF
jgi:hypothetical protein